jgi:hypothetical protein
MSRARPPLPDRHTPPVSAVLRALSLSPSRYPVGTTCRHQLSLRTRAFSLSCGPHLSALLPVRSPALSVPWAPPVGTVPPNQSRSPLWTHPRPRVSRPRPHAPEPFLEPAHTHSPSSAQLRPQPSTLALSLSTRAHEARRGLPPILWPPLSFCDVCCLSELRPFASNVGHLLVRPQHLWFARSVLTSFLTLQSELHHRRPEVSLRPRRCSGTPESAPNVRNSPTPLILRVLPCHSRICLPERVCTVVGLL